VDESATGSVYSFPSIVTTARPVPGVGFVIRHNPLGADQEAAAPLPVRCDARLGGVASGRRWL